MSEAMTPQLKKPAAEFLSPTPDFEMGGLLPQTRGDVLRNYRTQRTAYDPFEQQSMDAHRAAGLVYPGPPCMKIVTITLCFDGTNNHEPSDAMALPSTTTNVARLYHASVGRNDSKAAEQEGFYAYYMQGVGTEFKEIGEFKPDSQGLTMSTGGENRINWALTRLIDALKRASSKERLKNPDAYALDCKKWAQPYRRTHSVLRYSKTAIRV
ncbi:phospholipase effector Tle1 domain-containing protein, partial [Pseudomonas kitaguniensis]|uniref:phospholipase effector Tle1 domain-containing protein n=1 Tax=Pseudomonas kitaguniensis TaxID=2607908 RepID=UPI001F502CCC